MNSVGTGNFLIMMVGTEGNTISLSDVLVEEHVCLLSASTKSDALKHLIGVLTASEQVNDAVAVERAILEREELMSTGMGLGLAVPHVRSTAVNDLVLVVGVSDTPIEDYESLDGEPVRMLFMIAVRPDQHVQYLKLLSAVSNRLKDAAFRESLLRADSAASLYSLLIDG